MGRGFKETYSPDPKKYEDGYNHVFRKDLCECEECKERREEKESEE